MSDGPLLLSNVNNAAGAEIDEERLVLLLDSAYRSRRKKPACLDLLITTDAEMARMNRRHLGLGDATDVLAFDDGEEEDGRVRLGDVAINLDAARRAEGERGVGREQELAFYALHGLLHLLGMRDGDDADRAAMHAAQAGALRDFGWTPEEGLLGRE